ncbi:quinone oxidoreductase [Myxococcota bacterium]|nr:quinone oxidoreductase [Myxococcota bacterium]
MQQIVAEHPGGPEVLQLVERPSPTPGAAELRVRVEAAGVNFIDVYHRTGLYPLPAPIALGLEGAGIVEALGPGVTDVAVGDRVAWAGAQGSYASEVVVAANKAVRVPDGVDAKTAAAIMLQGMTAELLSSSAYPLGPRDTCLVHAAAGGVGLLLVQLAKRRGARVIGTVSSRDKAELARAAGADEVILYTESDFVAEVARLTGGTKVDVVYDSVGRTTFDRSLDCLRPRGMMVLFGQSSGPVPPVDLQVLARKGSLFVTRPTLFSYVATREELLARASTIFDAVREGSLTVRIHDVLPLARAADAHRALEGRRTTGKLLLVP